MDISALKKFLKSKAGIAVMAAVMCLIVVIGVAIGMSGQKEDTQQLASDSKDVILRENNVQESSAVVSETVETAVEESVSTNVLETVEDVETLSADTTETEDTGALAEVEEAKEKPVKDKENKNNTPKVEVKEEQVPLAEEVPVQLQPQVIVPEKPQASESKPVGSSKPSTSESGSSGNNQDSKPEVEKPSVEESKEDEYQLVWMDDFNDAKLNMDDWNYEYHEPGWVNHELQEYVDSEKNIYLKDGNLVIQAIKTVDEQGNAYYTSGRVNTQNKHDYKYGRFEARAKVPSGKGFLPAFWMMPTDESFYGQWPKCGEIDIMEVLGDKLTTTHGTLHFGEPHTMRQGGYTLKEGDFASEFHVFACEWEPGEIRFYVDGNLFYTVNDWFTKREGYGEVAYPAPYDQPFYMILNLAVGGDWPGYPDADAVFAENAQLVVDYVKVYQKDSYDENVKKPEIKVELREPDITGNYVINGDFSAAESMTDGAGWEFLLAGTGAATAEISDNTLHIMTTNAGNLDYSVQIVQAGQPLEKGYKYRLSFDAYADEARTIITSVTAPDDGYKRYLADTKLELMAGEKKNYSYEFDMLTKSDANGRVEFNLGNQGSIATVHISNVRLERVSEADIPEEVKTVLPDGNYVYNGQFQEGEGRLAYWDVVTGNADVKAEVTNTGGNRELMVIVPSTVTELSQVIVQQNPIAITGGKKYVLSFDAYADGEKSIQTVIADTTFISDLTASKKNFKYTFETNSDLKGSMIRFLLGTEGTFYIDNVRVQEDGMLVNGDFSNGLTGYEVYCHEASKTSYGVDGLKEANAFCMDIENTGDMDWHIQLKQNNVTLEHGKWYQLSFDAKSSVDRRIMYALQRDGSADNDWTPYSGTQKIDVSSSYQRFSVTFRMMCETDKQTILSISMGAVDGVQLTQRHTVAIDNIVLEEVEEPQKEEPEQGESTTPEEKPEQGDEQTVSELIKNGDFANQDADWVNAITAPGEATADFTQGKAVYNVTNPGAEDWNVQLKQTGLMLENGASYEVSFKMTSSESRIVKYALLNPNAGYDWYGGEDLNLVAGEEKIVCNTIYVDKATADTIEFVISMGQIAGVETPNSQIEISEISIVKK
ncbi:MAG: glycosyl hydrolase family protein [Lachnospiraceae bacterium]|nr:glycosyl hydrolase family protein [Lachnospiraceae bacterium]